MTENYQTLEREMLNATTAPTVATMEIHKPTKITHQNHISANLRNKTIRFIDLFSGIGGIRKGLELACEEKDIQCECVFTSEIKPAAIKIFRQNHPDEKIHGDITKIDVSDIPDFDILLAGFPCQAFSTAGLRRGFQDTRGTLFFEVERILKDKKPIGFILENVEGLVNHDGGRTLKVMTDHLKDLGYKVAYRVLNSKRFGVPQERKRVYIVGTLDRDVNLDDFPVSESKLASVLENGKTTLDSKFIRQLLANYSVEQLYGKSIKDKRGGKDNIHSWDIGMKGDVTEDEKHLLNLILTERRKKKWAPIIGVEWMDGMCLTKDMIATFYHKGNLKELLYDLTLKGYLVLEHPKKKVVENGISKRVYDRTKPKGYNIVAGKLSFEINKILDPNGISPTLVAMDMGKLYVVDNGGVRKITLREGLRLFGYPDDYEFKVTEKEGFDLLGNTVVVPVIKAVAGRLLETITDN